MTIDEMKKRKKELGLSNETISRLSGVPFSTVQKIFSGSTDAPRQKTVEALAKVLSAKPEGNPITDSQTAVHAPDGSTPAKISSCHYPQRIAKAGILKESTVAYQTKRQGDYTVEDYYAIPDDRRVELIDGEIFDMGAPSVRHQTILGELYILFRECIAAHSTECKVLLSPCDVQLDCDDKTMVQPDLLVMCRKFDVNGKCIWGAPDLTVEILSESTRSKDLLLKTYKYKNAGVREYWIIDPKKNAVLVYDFSEEDLTPEKYCFEDEIPVRISEGKCKIDFGRVKAALE